ncbi:MAG: 2,4-dihydroxyhept-2-ene-1,7-dioic acid aldolase [bacterium]|nr:2,4-dihydroxyhept-2-ene-1,7-dioic acid aldolase [bacterium]
MTDKKISFKQKLKQGKPLVGPLQALASSEVTEILVGAGFDWLFVDMEHSVIDVPVMQRILQAAQRHKPCVVRAPSHEEVWIKKILDADADGIIIPQVKTVAETENIIRMCKFPPEGGRSVGIARAHGYGMDFARCIAEANDFIAVIPQIEHIDGVNNIEDILKVKGIDAIFIGPYDLSGSMGMTGKVKSPEVLEAVDRVRKVCLEAGIPVGIFTTEPEAVKGLAEQGYSFIALGIDTIYLGNAIREALNKI